MVSEVGLPAWKHYTEAELRIKEKTGFDALLEKKHLDIETIRKMILSEPNITRAEIKRRTGLSFSTITRHLSFIKRQYKKGTIETQDVKQLKAKHARILKLEGLLLHHPEYTPVQLASEIGVSKRKLVKYLKDIRKESASE